MSTSRADPDRVRTRDAGRACLRWLAVAVSLPLGAACTTLHWEKRGADAATLALDLEDCARTARLEARRQELPRFGSPLTIRADPQGNPVVVPDTTRDADRFRLEQDLTGACMRGKGYARVPEKH